ncbi:unnamed protein product [Dracunculus medinensis]|uniref:Uncharacterized protein n=1 Tax=Dracunculus medinensis TaxID=318479 RepID=A0A3P7PUC5_DRAME|nr:unnamed protein product [Dracunculus medinensis]
MASGVAPDDPNELFYNQEKVTTLEGLIKGVSPEWGYDLTDRETLVLILPASQPVLTISKVAFVSLLEFCEDELLVKRVIISIDKGKLTKEVLVAYVFFIRQYDNTLLSWAICYKYIGFTPLHPEHCPSSIDPEKNFSMIYNIK